MKIKDANNGFEVFINLKSCGVVSTEKEVWDMIGKAPFGSLYEVIDPVTYEAIDEFVPF